MITEVGVAVGRVVVERAGRLWSQFHEASPLNADVFESEDAYLVIFDVPGATHSDVQVRFVDGEVLVRLDRFRDVHEGFEMVFPGRGMALDGRAALPEDARVDAQAASATLTTRGTLEVTVPKVEGTGEDADAEEVVDEADAEEAVDQADAEEAVAGDADGE
jgi:HSP20 family molecular chaperone IbpA